MSSGKGLVSLSNDRESFDFAMDTLLDEDESYTLSSSNFDPICPCTPPLNDVEIAGAPLVESWLRNEGLGDDASGDFVFSFTGQGAAVRHGMRGHSGAMTMTRSQVRDMKKCRPLWMYLFVASCDLHSVLPRWAWIDTFLNSKLP